MTPASRPVGRPLKHAVLTRETVEAVYRDEQVPIRVHAARLKVPTAALKAAIHRMGLTGRHWAIYCPHCGEAIKREGARG